MSMNCQACWSRGLARKKRKLLALPFKLVWNGIIGAVMLWLANLLGGALFNVTIHITIIKALIAGFFGIPGAAAVILWDLFVK